MQMTMLALALAMGQPAPLKTVPDLPPMSGPVERLIVTPGYVGVVMWWVDRPGYGRQPADNTVVIDAKGAVLTLDDKPVTVKDLIGEFVAGRRLSAVTHPLNNTNGTATAAEFTTVTDAVKVLAAPAVTYPQGVIVAPPMVYQLMSTAAGCGAAQVTAAGQFTASGTLTLPIRQPGQRVRELLAPFRKLFPRGGCQ